MTAGHFQDQVPRAWRLGSGLLHCACEAAARPDPCPFAFAPAGLRRNCRRRSAEPAVGLVLIRVLQAVAHATARPDRRALIAHQLRLISPSPIGTSGSGTT